jgi:hypothetical protein
MKKVIKIIGMMCLGAVLVLGASSCKKDKTEKVSSFDISLPAIEGESGISDDSKAYIDLTDNIMKWYDGDYVMMYSIDEDYTKSQAYPFIGEGSITGATQAHFSGIQMVEGSEGFFAFYPASKASTEIKHDNRVTFNVGEMQTYETDLYAGTAYEGRIFMDPRCVVAAATCDIVDNSAAFSLKHIFGYFNVRIKNGDSKNLKSVTITDNNLHLTGSMSVKIPALKSADLDAMKGYGLAYRNGTDETMPIEDYWAGINTTLQQIGYKGNGTGYSVTLDCSAANGGTGAPITSKNKYFLMALRPGALMNGFTITLKFADDSIDPIEYEVGPNHQYITIPGTYTVISIDLAQPNGGL